MPTTFANIGRDAQIVFIDGTVGQITINVTDFRYRINKHKLMSRVLGQPTRVARIPDYVSGSFKIDRNSNAMEVKESTAAQVFYAGGAIPDDTVYVYIAEVNGSTTTLTLTNVTTELTENEYKNEDIVKQTVEFDASVMEVA